MELRVVGGQARGHHSLGVNQAVGRCGLARGRDGATAGLGVPQIKDSEGRWRSRRPAEEMVTTLRSTVTVEHYLWRYGGEHCGEWSNRIRLEATG